MVDCLAGWLASWHQGPDDKVNLRALAEFAYICGLYLIPWLMMSAALLRSVPCRSALRFGSLRMLNTLVRHNHVPPITITIPIIIITVVVVVIVILLHRQTYWLAIGYHWPNWNVCQLEIFNGLPNPPKSVCVRRMLKRPNQHYNRKCLSNNFNADVFAVVDKLLRSALEKID